jgi:type II secretory pathway predicted ATPase ExeA
MTALTSHTHISKLLSDAPDPNDPAAFCRWLRGRYMRNPRDDLFRAALQEILVTTPAGTLTATPMRFDLVNETRGILAYGETGSGKSALIGRNLRREPAIGLWEGEGEGTGKAFYIRVPPSATLKGLATEMANKTGYHVATKLRTTEVWDLAKHRLAQRGVTILWIDEAHHLLRGKEAEEVRQHLKSLMQGDKAMALIVSGIPSLDANIRMDRETDRRFEARVALGPMRTEQERAKLREFFDLCCELARLAPPRDAHLVERLEAVTHSSLGASIELFQKAIYRALRRRDGRLTLEDFQSLYDMKRGFHAISPFDPEDWPSLKDRLQALGWAPQ